MNYIDLINLTLQELNYKQIADFTELVKPDYKKVATSVSRVNDNVLYGNDWQFLMRELELDVPADATSIPRPKGIKIKNAYIDGKLLCYTPACERFLMGNGGKNEFGIFDDKILLTPANHARRLKLIYKTENSAKTATGEEIAVLTNSSDESLMPERFAKSVVVFGSCIEFKSDPSHPRYKH